MTLQLTVQPLQQSYLKGESLPVRATLTNTGDAPATVPESYEKAFEYVITPVAGTQAFGGAALLLSRAQSMQLQGLDPEEQPAPEMTTLPPGETLEYSPENLARLAPSPIPVGEYELVARYGDWPDLTVSPPARVSVVVPHVERLVATRGPAKAGLAICFTHREADGTHALYQYESKARRPARGVFYRHHTAPHEELDRFACAIDYDDCDRIRWFGWLQGMDGFVAAAAQLAELLVVMKPVDPGLAQAEPFPIGWQWASGEVLFALLEGTGDEPRLGTVTYRPVRQSATHTAPHTPLAREHPIALRHLDADGPTGRLLLVGIGPAGGAPLIAQVVDTAEGRAAEPRQWASPGGTVAALALDPIGTLENAVIDLLTGPAGDPAMMTLTRIPLRDGAEPSTWTFAPPLDDRDQPPDAWVLPTQPLDPPLVMARLGGRLLIGGPRAGDWRTLHPGPEPATHMCLEVIQGEPWAIWADAANGIQIVPALAAAAPPDPADSQPAEPAPTE